MDSDIDRRAPGLGDPVAVHAEHGRAALRRIHPELTFELIIVPKLASGAVVALLQPDNRRPPVGLARGYGMLCGSDPKRNDSWTLRVDVPSLRFGVVVRVNLHFCAGNVVPAILDVENRADLGRERPAVAFPCAGQPEGFRRDRAGEPYGASYWPLAGYGMLLNANYSNINVVVVRITSRTI